MNKHEHDLITLDDLLIKMDIYDIDHLNAANDDQYEPFTNLEQTTFEFN